MDMMPRPVLFLLAHPDLRVSRANRALAAAAHAVEGVVVHDIYSSYPDLFIDGAAERQRIEDASALILQFPVYWYSAPGLLKEWMDRTLVSGWAYGPSGDRLRGKPFGISVTTGSGPDAYRPDGVHGNSIDAYLAPFEQTARFCGMVWQPPLIHHRARNPDEAALDAHKIRLTSMLQALATRIPA